MLFARKYLWLAVTLLAASLGTAAANDASNQADVRPLYAQTIEYERDSYVLELSSGSSGQASDARRIFVNDSGHLVVLTGTEGRWTRHVKPRHAVELSSAATEQLTLAIGEERSSLYTVEIPAGVVARLTRSAGRTY